MWPTGSLICHGLSFISDLGHCRAHHLIRTLIHPGCQGRVNQIGLWNPLHLTQFVVTAAKSKKQKAQRALTWLVVRVALCLTRGSLEHCVIRNASHLFRPIASLRVQRCNPNSVARLRMLLALVRQSAVTRYMFDNFSHSGRMYNN